jgi:hypothetical protein
MKLNKALIEAVVSSDPVKGYTHNFYRYPARFSPQFVRAVINQFSAPEDLVLDPFMGGGTSIVEALTMSRSAIGIDINELAHFVATVKTTPLSSKDKSQILHWFAQVNHLIIGGATPITPVANFPMYMQELFARYLSNIELLSSERQRRFAQCVLLKTGQWAVDCRHTLPDAEAIVARINSNVSEMFCGLDAFQYACQNAGVPKNQITYRRKLFCQSVTDLDKIPDIINLPQKPRLVVTSPPYPGVHVLYHRWQINGRRETPAPYWLASLNDGNGEGFYTLGGRSRIGLEKYFISITQAFRSIRNVIHPHAHVIQLVAFSRVEEQLTKYLYAMKEAGYKEVQLYKNEEQMSVWRDVPNRKWYSRVRGEHDCTRELLLIHQPS